jgi:hypothetical protein
MREANLTLRVFCVCSACVVQCGSCPLLALEFRPAEMGRVLIVLDKWIFNGGSGTNWYLKVPYGYQASKSLAQPEKRGFAPQDIVLLTYHAKILVLRSVR